MYSVLSYGEMATDSVRMDAYGRAIERAVKPGSIVLDIGAGTGIFSLLAARAGARRVHAVEPNPAIWVLPELARENGLEDRIQVHHASSFDLQLEEKADVIVSDLRGSVPIHEDHIAILRDAKERLLAPGGVLIPQRDVLWAGLVESDGISTMLANGTVAFERRGLSAGAARRSILNCPISDNGHLRSSDLVTTSAPWGTVEYGVHRGGLDGEVELHARRDGRAHAIATWFAATTMDELGYSNEPGTTLAYSRFVFPLLSPIELRHGDHAHVVLRVDERGSRWAWETEVRTADGQIKARMKQSTFFGAPTSPDALFRTSSTFAACPSARGERLKKTLELMDGKRTVAEIADLLSASDKALPSHNILEEVRDFVARYGR